MGKSASTSKVKRIRAIKGITIGRLSISSFGFEEMITIVKTAEMKIKEEKFKPHAVNSLYGFMCSIYQINYFNPD